MGLMVATASAPTVHYRFHSSTSVTAPPWARRARIIVHAGGGGGAGSNTATDRASGGGGGGFGESLWPIIPSETITITVAATAAGGVNASGAAGGTSSVMLTAGTITAL